MNAETARVKDEFLVLHDGVIAAVRLDHSIAGCGILVRALHDPVAGREIHVGRIVGACSTIDEAYRVGTVAAIQAVDQLRGQSIADDGFVLRARAIRQAGDRGEFDPVVEIANRMGDLTDRIFIRIHGSEPCSADNALATARDALGHVDGITGDGKFIK